MTDTKRLNVAQMDFEEIKSNLKTYLRSQSSLQDYDYEGSAMGTLVDLLAYVTHYNAVNANLGLNETFLDTAQFRGSVVGHARQLGYTPRSATASAAYVNLAIISYSGSDPVTMLKGTRFRSVINGRSYDFVADQDYTTTDGLFNDVRLVQGSYKTVEYVYDVSGSEKFLIPDSNVDTSNMTVEVYDSETSATKRTFSRAKLITGINRDSRVYFLAENPDGRYELTFGDGILGAALEDGNIIHVTYLVTNHVEANGAGVFTGVDPIYQGSAPTVIQTVARATGGQERESIEEIRRNSPLSFASQNRAVTADDYKAIILENFQNVETIAVWGGEDNDPPSYGNIYISIKPKNGEILFAGEREAVLNDVIRPKSVVSLTPILVDPEYTYISLEVFYKYDVSTTPLSKTTLNSAVRAAIQTYNNTYLSKFDGVLRHSNLVRSIDKANNSILSSSARVYMKKRFTPELNLPQRVELQFSGPIYNDPDDQVIYKTTSFTYGGRQCSLRDVVGSNGVRRVQVVYGEGANTVVIADNVGTVDTVRGRITLNEFIVSNFVGDYIEITVIPDSLDIAPLRNNLLVIDTTDVAVDGEIDTIVAGQSPAGVNYRTISRHA